MNRPAALSFSVFRGSMAISEGHLSVKELRSKAWRQIRQDVYVDARLTLDHAVACHAAALVLPDDICFSGPSAAYLMGVAHAAHYEDDVQLTIAPGAHLPKRTGVRVRTSPLPVIDCDWAGGLQVTSPARTAWDLGASLPVWRSVPIIDALLGLALITSHELHGYAQPRVSRRGGRNAERAFGLADGRARTPEASRLRLAVLAAGLPEPTPHHPVSFSGRVRTPELAWPKQRVGVAFPTDDGRYSDADWIVVRVDPDDFDAQLPGALRDLRAALLGRGWQGQP